MKKRVLAFSLVFVLLFATAALAGTVKEYTADLVDVETGDVVQRMYVTEQKMRFDTFGEGEEPEAIAILRLDQGVIYALGVEEQTYFSIPAPKNLPSVWDMGGMLTMGLKQDIRREKLGAETVNGYQAEKEKVTVSIDMMGQKIVLESYEWLAPEYAPVPVRTEDPADHSATELRNIVQGAPDASVFEIPAGYEKDPELEAMMKMLMK